MGGSGVYSLKGLSVHKEHSLTTPFGNTSGTIVEGEYCGHTMFFIPRHGRKHTLLPSEVPYAANVFALKSLGVKTLISVSAVGSLRSEIKPGDLVVPSTYYDRTKGLRRSTFCGDGAVGHVSLAHPVDAGLQQLVRQQVGSVKYDAHFEKCYVCIEGPHFSTQYESQAYRQAGCDVIGMTNFPEYALAREAGISYLPLCFVTDYDSWDTSLQHVTVAAVLDTMRENSAKAHDLLKGILDSLSAEHLVGCANQGLKTSLLTPLDHMDPERRKVFAILQA